VAEERQSVVVDWNAEHCFFPVMELTWLTTKLLLPWIPASIGERLNKHALFLKIVHKTSEEENQKESIQFSSSTMTKEETPPNERRRSSTGMIERRTPSSKPGRDAIDSLSDISNYCSLACTESPSSHLRGKFRISTIIELCFSFSLV